MTRIVSNIPMNLFLETYPCGPTQERILDDCSLTDLVEYMDGEDDFEPTPIGEHHNDGYTDDEEFTEASDSCFDRYDETQEVRNLDNTNDQQDTPMTTLDPIPMKYHFPNDKKLIDDFSSIKFLGNVIPPEEGRTESALSPHYNPILNPITLSDPPGEVTRSQEDPSHHATIHRSSVASLTGPHEVKNTCDESMLNFEHFRFQENCHPTKRRMSMPSLSSCNTSSCIKTAEPHEYHNVESNDATTTQDLRDASTTFSKHNQGSYDMLKIHPSSEHQVQSNSNKSFQQNHNISTQDSSWYQPTAVVTSSASMGYCHYHDGHSDMKMYDEDGLSIKLKTLMMKSSMSQKALQKWDKKMGLPKNHSPSMMKSNLSRRQLQEGVLLKTHTGNLLIDAVKDSATSSNKKMERRNTCPS